VASVNEAEIGPAVESPFAVIERAVWLSAMGRMRLFCPSGPATAALGLRLTAKLTHHLVLVRPHNEFLPLPFHQFQRHVNVRAVD